MKLAAKRNEDNGAKVPHSDPMFAQRWPACAESPSGGTVNKKKTDRGSVALVDGHAFPHVVLRQSM